jgi:hypothetical protein
MSLSDRILGKVSAWMGVKLSKPKSDNRDVSFVGSCISKLWEKLATNYLKFNK